MVFKDLNRKVLFLLVLALVTFPAWGNLNFIKDNTLFSQAVEAPKAVVEKEADDFKKILSNHQDWVEQVDYDSSKYNVQYTFNAELEDFIQKQLSLYRPDYTSVVVMDNETGHILAAVDYSRKHKVFGRDLAFTNTHPAASIFKVITAADLLENTHIKTDSEFHFTGRSTTLYKHQLKEPNGRHRWTRSLDLKKAFATSNNVIFGRTAIENLTPAGLKKMAEKFGFNKKLVEGVNLKPSVFNLAKDQYNLAEYSSGLNTQTLMSPVHGAVIGSIVANGGVLRYPIVIKSLESHDDKKIIYPSLKKDEIVLTPSTSEDLRTLFMGTVTNGTARSSFRRSKYLLEKLEIGGKTGSLTGGEPFGKRDWFVSYAKSLEDKNDKGISICVMIVNQKKWYIKSPLLAKNIMEYYYSTLYPQKK
ncbi:MAG: penicillin-binding transpeptidase domain-containing protein [Bacteriovoracaceae bacterium]|nr:penicillin-binding transpeptidase domain-containing protein [Bacteriovoracaceae bacterium]